MTSVQRLMSAEEIALSQVSGPAFVRMPDGAARFAERASRLDALAPGNPMQAYLALVAEVARAQAAVVEHDFGAASLPDETALAHAAEHLMPPIPVASWRRDPVWRRMLAMLVDTIERASPAAAAAPETRTVLARLRSADDAWLEDQANRILNDRELELDKGAAVFIGAALQVYWIWMLRALGEKPVGRLATPTLCPCCGSRPVASIVRSSGDGSHRYLACRLCATEWYYERIKCPTCESTAGIEYVQLDEGGDAASVDPGALGARAASGATVKAETCSACQTYTKIVAGDRVPGAEPVADDLASLALDVTLAEQTGFMRATLNLALFPGHADDAD
ncbi:MAG: formate dehydrogenase accessory protein FdhE [Lautropia sp.]